MPKLQKSFTASLQLPQERIDALFDALDITKRGFLDEDTILGTAQTLSFKQDLLNACKQNGRLERKEFNEIVRANEMRISSLFFQLDRGGTGDLDIDDIRFALERSGVDIDETELSQFIKHIDLDNSGIISFENWAEFLLRLPNHSTLRNIFMYYLHFIHQTDAYGDTVIQPEEEEVVHSRETFKYFLAGGIAGAISRTCTAPLDRIRVFLQIQITPPLVSTSFLSRISNNLVNIRTLASQIYSDGGVASFWRGNGVNIIKIIPESSIRFYVFEWSKNWLRNNHLMSDNSVETTVYQRMIAGGVAGFASQFFVYPLDTLKTRMMAEMSAQIIKKKNIDSSKVRVKAYKVAKTMFQKEGIRSFYRGVGPSLLGIVPYASIDLTAYETLKLTYIKFRPDNEPSPVVHLVCGAFSGALSSSIIYPLGLAQGTSTHSKRYSGAFDVARHTFRTEGIRGFYRGLIPTLVKVVPAVSISYIVYENAKKHLNIP